MKVVKPQEVVPKNVVHFKVSNEMTEFDVRNYLTKIYKLPVAAVKVEMKNGNVVRSLKQHIIKEADYKMAYVTMDKEFEFTFPDIPDRPGMDLYEKSIEQNKKERAALQRKYEKRPGGYLCSWRCCIIIS